MRQIVQSIALNPKYSKLIHWSKLISLTGSTQLIVQAVSLICGILVIQVLSTQEYAIYTLANTMLGTMVVLSDGGISAGVMSEGGKVWQDGKKLGGVVVAGTQLRKQFAIGSLLVAIPILIYLLRYHGASWVTAILILFSLIVAFSSSLYGGLLQVAPKLKQDIGPLQKNQVEINIARLLLLAVTIFIFPFAFVALLASAVPQIWGNIRLKGVTKKYVDWEQKSDLNARKNIIKVTKRLLPGAVYYCFSGQITIWLISIFGSTTAVAQIGALGRLGMVLNVFSVLFLTLILPRFVRFKNDFKPLLFRFILIQVGLLLLITVIILVVGLFPSEILWILGKDYANLDDEILLSITCSCIGLISGSTFHLCSSKGWTINPIFTISINIASIVIAIFLIDISTLIGVLKFNIFVITVQALMNVFYGLYKIISIGNSERKLEVS